MASIASCTVAYPASRINTKMADSVTVALTVAVSDIYINLVFI